MSAGWLRMHCVPPLSHRPCAKNHPVIDGPPSVLKRYAPTPTPAEGRRVDRQHRVRLRSTPAGSAPICTERLIGPRTDRRRDSYGDAREPGHDSRATSPPQHPPLTKRAAQISLYLDCVPPVSAGGRSFREGREFPKASSLDDRMPPALFTKSVEVLELESSHSQGWLVRFQGQGAG